MRNLNKSRNILILHNYADETLARLLLAHLGGKIEGFILDKRNERWGCVPSIYRLVISLNGAGSLSDPNVVVVHTQSYEEASLKHEHIQYTLHKHYDVQAAEAADKVVNLCK